MNMCALRFIYEDFNSDYDTLLLKSGLPSLKIRLKHKTTVEALARSRIYPTI